MLVKLTEAHNNVPPSRHYLFDPSADMLYNPWLGQKVAWPEQKAGKGKKKLSSQFMSQHVNRKYCRTFLNADFSGAS